MRLTPRQWRALLQWFVRGVSSAVIAHETGLERKRVLRALTVMRLAMARSVPPAFRRVEVEARDSVSALATAERTQPSAAGARASVVGLHVAHGEAWAELVPEVQAAVLRKALRMRKRPRLIEQPIEVRYGAVAYRGRFYRLTISGRGEAPARFGELEAFWAYLRHQLRAKGGIRPNRLGLYLAEYAWRYNHRRLSRAQQLRELFTLLRRAPQGWMERDFP